MVYIHCTCMLDMVMCCIFYAMECTHVPYRSDSYDYRYSMLTLNVECMAARLCLIIPLRAGVENTKQERTDLAGFSKSLLSN